MPNPWPIPLATLLDQLAAPTATSGIKSRARAARHQQQLRTRLETILDSDFSLLADHPELRDLLPHHRLLASDALRSASVIADPRDPLGRSAIAACLVAASPLADATAEIGFHQTLARLDPRLRASQTLDLATICTADPRFFRRLQHEILPAGWIPQGCPLAPSAPGDLGIRLLPLGPSPAPITDLPLPPGAIAWRDSINTVFGDVGRTAAQPVHWQPGFAEGHITLVLDRTLAEVTIRWGSAANTKQLHYRLLPSAHCAAAIAKAFHASAQTAGFATGYRRLNETTETLEYLPLIWSSLLTTRPPSTHHEPIADMISCSALALNPTPANAALVAELQSAPIPPGLAPTPRDHAMIKAALNSTAGVLGNA